MGDAVGEMDIHTCLLANPPFYKRFSPNKCATRILTAYPTPSMQKKQRTLIANSTPQAPTAELASGSSPARIVISSAAHQSTTWQSLGSSACCHGLNGRLGQRGCRA